eukprot:CAMPEP_0201490920 /NCGR_PEP_ID=MMETSP0151_2-20130828/27929_1 /ASSEMBLY_ACC=CAM_ASM_000257 /TAXON_ID=200890 /ORGANISM="Paramoeba atlantica, Strain 621/1 / CCAP 1560/9" /LENGTH=258 /DNA_ID=CAMNT_0047877061 /DNA_START=88 /DNA_END=861 /DNA_ORIENTATION=+
MPPKEIRCSRCKSFYFDCENWETSCRYHRGKYIAIVSGGSGLINMSQAKKWSCCKSEDPDASPCRTGYHIEDTDFTDFLCESYSSISRNSTGPRSDGKLHLQPKLPSKSEHPIGNTEIQDLTDDEDLKKFDLDDEPVPDGYQKHLVCETDTIRRLELAYEVSGEKIKHTNQLVTDRDLHGREYLLIPSTKVPNLPPPPPVSKETKQNRKVTLFMSITKCASPLEARGYLETCQWDCRIAVAEYRKDIQWEEKENIKQW